MFFKNYIKKIIREVIKEENIKIGSMEVTSKDAKKFMEQMKNQMALGALVSKR
jgi:hypothetical protein